MHTKPLGKSAFLLILPLVIGTSGCAIFGEAVIPISQDVNFAFAAEETDGAIEVRYCSSNGDTCGAESLLVEAGDDGIFRWTEVFPGRIFGPIIPLLQERYILTAQVAQGREIIVRVNGVAFLIEMEQGRQVTMNGVTLSVEQVGLPRRAEFDE